MHGCIDGFSRRIIYFKVSNNNRAETVFGLFRDAVTCVGIPSRVKEIEEGKTYKLHIS